MTLVVRTSRSSSDTGTMAAPPIHLPRRTSGESPSDECADTRGGGSHRTWVVVVAGTTFRAYHTLAPHHTVKRRSPTDCTRRCDRQLPFR